MPGELLIFAVGTIIGLAFATYKFTKVLYRFISDWSSGRLERDSSRKIIDAAARKTVDDIKLIGYMLIVGIIGGPILILTLMIGPFVLLGGGALAIVVWIIKACMPGK